MGRNLVPIGTDSSAPWLGSGFHFAMEDFHGHKRFPTASAALEAYVAAQKAGELPGDWRELRELGLGMVEYYTDDWIKRHRLGFETLWVDGVPQVEVAVRIDLTSLLPPALIRRLKRDVHYVTTYDRVVVDEEGHLWVLDYKTAKAMDILNLATNPQSGSYDWSAAIFYGALDIPVEGVIWQQHLKAIPHPPALVAVGKKNEHFSTAKDQYTTWNLYRQTLLDHYGHVPQDYVEFLNMLAEGEQELSDRFIRIDKLRRNDYQREAEQEHIVAEVTEMLSAELPLYPNFTRDCSWDCPFRAPCLAMDDGSDAEYLLANEYEQWQGYKDDWRERIKYPTRKAVNAT